jgi:hypothetical protein
MRTSGSIGALAALALVAAGCAGATVGSGVGDRYLEHPPWYAGSAPVAADEALRHLPVAYQRGGSQPEAFDPAAGAGTPMAALLAEMNAYLDSLGVSTPVDPAVRPAGTAPDVRFGCEADASGDCAELGDQPGEVGDPVMRLAVGRPSDEWTAGLARALGPDSALVLILAVEVGQYYPQQTNFAGAKAVELGTDHTVRLPWLTSLESPVSVVQLTGAVVNREGRALRIGAEGMVARRTGLVASGVGLQALIRDEDVAALRTARRDDLPGEPLVWQVALRNLVAGLTGR